MASAPPSMNEGGRLEIPVVANLAPFERMIQQDLPRRAKDAGKRAAQALAEGISDRQGMQQRMQQIATQTVDQYVEGAKARLARRKAEIAEELARGIIDPREAERRGQAAGKAFSDGIIREIDRRGRAGRLTDDDYMKLASSLKATGVRGAKAFRSEFGDLERWLRTGLTAGIIGAIGYAMSRAVAMVRAGAQRIRDFLERGSTATRVGEGFGELAGRRGLSASGTLDALRRGSRGEVANIELMRRANLALLSDLPLTERAMERIAVVSRRLGQAVGKDAAESYEYFIRAINTGQSDMLKQLGLTTTLEGALRRYKEQTGRSAESLSEAQRVTILYNAVMAEAEEKVARMGRESETASTFIGQLAAQTTNLLDATARAVSESPPLLEFLRTIAGDADEAAGRIQNLANWLGALADTFGESTPVQAALWVARTNLRSQASAQATIANNASGGALQRNFQRRQFASEQEGLRGRIGGMGEQEVRLRLQEEQLSLQLLQRQIALLRQKKGTEEEEDLLWEQREERLKTRLALEERLAALEEDDVEPPPDPIDPNELKRLQQIVEDFRRSQLLDAERNLEDLLRVQEAAAKIGDSEQLRAVEPLIHNARREVERLNELAAHMPELFARITPQVQTTFGELATVGIDARMSLQAFERDFALTMARIREEAERGIITDEQRAELEAAVLEEFNKKLLELLTTLREAGMLSEQVFLMITSAFKDGAEDTDELALNLRAVAGVARGVLSVADAVGKIGDNARRSLQGIVDLVDGISAMRTATDMVGKIGGGVTAIGGAIGLLSAVFGETPAQRENREAMRRNTEAITDLRLELAGWRATAASVAGARRAVEGFPAAAFVGVGRRFAQEELERRLALFGSSMEELSALAEKYGIDIFDDKGRIIGSRLEQLAEQLRQAERALVGWRDTVDDQRTRLELEADILDLDDDAFARLQRELDLLRQFAPGLVPAGADASTPEGRAAIEAMVRELFAQFSAGTLDLGNLTREEFLALLRAIESGLDETEGGVVGGDGSVRLGVSITEVQASRMLSELSTQTYYLSRIATAVAGPVLSAAPLALPSLASVNAPTTVTIGDVEFHFPNIRGALTEGAARRAGAAAGDALRQQLAAAHHAAGAQGTPRILTRTEG